METLLKSFQALGFKGAFSLGLIDHRHVLVRFNQEEDYLCCWLKGVWSLQGFVLRIFKWTPSFSVDSESPLAPIWASLPQLPVHLFNKGPLFSIARLLGEPLEIDALTASLNRPSMARFCVEGNLQQVLPDKIWIGNGASGFWQAVEYESLSGYWSVCRKLGHLSTSCRSLAATGQKLNLPPRNAATVNAGVGLKIATSAAKENPPSRSEPSSTLQPLG
ncbi:uncharacterized protein LOC113751917 [Coffea eugenioides]|uniref:uncharacterized protein LOC113751917 n=1 Tax=Coffea eugenioides TaxID=49369 RepID=UPI000F613AFD|nr:uncharacterized protein LOC113751917 [Coffea eugenioides]